MSGRIRRNSAKTSRPLIPGGYIKQNHGDVRFVGRKEIHRGAAIDGLDYGKTFPSEHLGNSKAERVFVFDYKDGSGNLATSPAEACGTVLGISWTDRCVHGNRTSKRVPWPNELTTSIAPQ
jgi:hypothetical protein